MGKSVYPHADFCKVGVKVVGNATRKMGGATLNRLMNHCKDHSDACLASWTRLK